MRRATTQPGERFRRVVLLVDVSGSMEPYARPLLRFVQAAVSARQRVEAFALGTRLTRMTRELSRRDPDEAMRLAACEGVWPTTGTGPTKGTRTWPSGSTICPGMTAA